MEINSKTTEKWVSTAVYYDKMESLLTEAVMPFLENEINTQTDKIISNFIFNRSGERGQNLILMFKGSPLACEEIIQSKLTQTLTEYLKQYPAPEKAIELPVFDWFLPFPSNHIEYNNAFLFDIMETGGLQSSSVGEQLLTNSSSMILQFFQQSSEEGWDPGSALGIAFQTHLALVSAFEMSPLEIKEFYGYMFQNMLKMTQGDGLNFQESLQNGLTENFESQKESIVGFVNYLLESFIAGDEFEEDWINTWVTQTKEVAQQMIKIQDEGYFVAPESYVYNKDLQTSAASQERWPVIEYYLRAINCQMGITNAIELNLIFTLQASIETILELE